LHNTHHRECFRRRGDSGGGRQQRKPLLFSCPGKGRRGQGGWPGTGFYRAGGGKKNKGAPSEVRKRKGGIGRRKFSSVGSHWGERKENEGRAPVWHCSGRGKGPCGGGGERGQAEGSGGAITRKVGNCTNLNEHCGERVLKMGDFLEKLNEN